MTDYFLNMNHLVKRQDSLITILTTVITFTPFESRQPFYYPANLASNSTSQLKNMDVKKVK